MVLWTYNLFLNALVVSSDQVSLGPNGIISETTLLELEYHCRDEQGECDDSLLPIDDSEDIDS